MGGCLGFSFLSSVGACLKWRCIREKYPQARVAHPRYQKKSPTGEKKSPFFCIEFSLMGLCHFPPMRSKNFTFRVPQPLRDLFNARALELGYPSAAAYLVGLIRYDLLTQKPHACTAELSKLSNREQDALDDEIAAMFGRSEAVHGSWFARCLERAVESVAHPGCKVAEHRTVNRLLEILREGHAEENSRHAH